MANSREYKLSIDLNSLNHLGIGLYSNVPAVMSETVANSWDADAKKVNITLDANRSIITIEDDGCGMTKDEINGKYLTVGYRRRDVEGGRATPTGRHVMGRKGIGKLSLFSVADTIEVHSVKREGKKIEKNGFIISVRALKNAIEAGGQRDYYPTPVKKNTIKIGKGTKITLRDLKKNLTTSEKYLRTRLARRFCVIGTEYDFSVLVNGKPISVEDRDYFEKIEYLWYFGQGSEKYHDYCTNVKRAEKLSGGVDEQLGYEVTGWVGTHDAQKSIEEGNNTIIVLAWGKLVLEDILKDLKEGGVFTKYLIGEIRADFLDLDDQEDIVTSDRQRLIETDPRFDKLKRYVQDEILKTIQSKWRSWRNQDATQEALQNPIIKEWYERLGFDNQKHAERLFGVIGSLQISDASDKNEIYQHGILAFETLALQGNLDALAQVETAEDFERVTSIIKDLDQIESVLYWEITKNRIAVLDTFEKMVPTAKEKFIQSHIFDHLWLLHPSWERASTDARMEQRVDKEWRKLDAKLRRKRNREDSTSNTERLRGNMSSSNSRSTIGKLWFRT